MVGRLLACERLLEGGVVGRLLEGGVVGGLLACEGLLKGCRGSWLRPNEDC